MLLSLSEFITNCPTTISLDSSPVPANDPFLLVFPVTGLRPHFQSTVWFWQQLFALSCLRRPTEMKIRSAAGSLGPLSSLLIYSFYIQQNQHCATSGQFLGSFLPLKRCAIFLVAFKAAVWDLRFHPVNMSAILFPCLFEGSSSHGLRKNGLGLD